MKRVIVNADDFGLHPAVTAGILRAAELGMISSTTVSANTCRRDDLMLLKASGLACGLHLNLVEGRPLTGQQGLEPILDGQGQFQGVARLAAAITLRRIELSRLWDEVRAQAAVLADAGVEIDHFDSHRHAHLLPGVSDLVVRIAQETGVAAVRISREPLDFAPHMARATVKRLLILPFARTASRKFANQGLRTPNSFFGIAILEPDDQFALLRSILPRLSEGTTEIALHLADVTALDSDAPSLMRWARNLEGLRKMDLPKALAEAGAVLSTYADIDSAVLKAITAEHVHRQPPAPKPIRKEVK